MTSDTPPPMSADRFRDLWKATGLSLRDLAPMIGMTGKHAATHLREMADGVRKVPGPTGIAVEALAFGWRPGAERADETDLTDALADAISDTFDMDTGAADYARAALATIRKYLGGTLWAPPVDWPPMADRERDRQYLEQADAHADEGPLGEPAARNILALALKYVRLVCPSPPSAAETVLEQMGRPA